MIQKVLAWMETDYRQLQAETVSQTASVLVSKKGKVTVKTKHRSIPVAKADMSHNRTKQYLLPEGEPVPFLVKLGVMTMEGKVVKAKYDKFRQINRFLEFIEDICPVLSRNREISMIDFGCGKSYLTFAMYYYLHEKKGFDLRITGLDLKEDVIAHCNALAEEFGYEKLKFLHGDIADYENRKEEHGTDLAGNENRAAEISRTCHPPGDSYHCGFRIRTDAGFFRECGHVGADRTVRREILCRKRHPVFGHYRD